MLLCALIIWLAYKFSRMLASVSGGRFRAKYMKEIERIAMGTESYISLVQCGSDFYLIGVTRQNISILGRVEEDTLQEISPGTLEGTGFKIENLRDSEFLKKLKSFSRK